MDIEDETTWPILSINVFDYNKTKSDVPLGYTYLWLKNSSYIINQTTLRQPKWNNLFLPKSNKQLGQINIFKYLNHLKKINKHK